MPGGRKDECGLTQRQREVVIAVAGFGLDNESVAKELNISRRAVDEHLLKLGRKLDLAGPTRTHLVYWAIRNGYVPLGSPLRAAIEYRERNHQPPLPEGEAE